MIMQISDRIKEYIENSKFNGRLCRWEKAVINIHITKISANITGKNFYYSEVERAVQNWNNILSENHIGLKFSIVNSPQQADVIVHWVKVGRVFEGMCNYLSIVNGTFKKISIDIGLFNEHSGKNTTNESIFFTIMHELGHTLGLGHGVEIDDLMFVPHQKNISIPSENDIFVLKQIYNITA